MSCATCGRAPVRRCSLRALHNFDDMFIPTERGTFSRSSPDLFPANKDEPSFLILTGYRKRRSIPDLCREEFLRLFREKTRAFDVCKPHEKNQRSYSLADHVLTK